MRMAVILALLALFSTNAVAEIRWVDSYSRRDGTVVSGHYKDTSADGNPWNNRKSVLGY